MTGLEPTSSDPVSHCILCDQPGFHGGFMVNCFAAFRRALTAAREELAEAKSSRAFSMFQSMKRQRDQAEQRVLELQRDLSDTTAECEFRAETIARLGQRVRHIVGDLHGDAECRAPDLEQRLAESQQENADREALEAGLRRQLEELQTALQFHVDYQNERLCTCGHSYYRHFNGFGEMYPVGCKHCPCHTWTAAGGEGA